MKAATSLVSLLVVTALNLHAQDTAYQWVGGTAGYSGTLVLDSPGSTAGNASDVASLTITSPLSGGTLVAVPSTVSLRDPIFTWNSSAIEEMYLTAYDAAGDEIYVGEHVFGSAENIVADTDVPGFTESDLSGTWVAVSGNNATVPDATNSICLLGLAAAGMAVWGRVLKSGRPWFSEKKAS